MNNLHCFLAFRKALRSSHPAKNDESTSVERPPDWSGRSGRRGEVRKEQPLATLILFHFGICEPQSYTIIEKTQSVKSNS
jgi:hypothetical protein